MSRSLRLALAGGGTGGHVVPGLRVLAELVRLPGSPLADLVWFVAGRPVEAAALAPLAALVEGVEHELVRLRLEPPGGGAPTRARLVRRLLPETLAARRALGRHRTSVLLGLGGFTSLPATLAARSLGIPVVLLEVNCVSGGATRWLAPLARHVVHAWPASLPAGEDGAGPKHVVLGPPLPREAFLEPEEGDPAAAARAALGFDPSRPLLVVLGGSQGARGPNRFVRDHGPGLVAAGLQILHQCGPGRAAESAPPSAGLRVVEFTGDVLLVLRAATVVLSRGGASTLAEVAAAARPAVVVPYPGSADRHQERNAEALGEGVEVVSDDALDGALAARLLALCSPEGAPERARRSRLLARAVPRDGARRLAALLAELGA